MSIEWLYQISCVKKQNKVYKAVYCLYDIKELYINILLLENNTMIFNFNKQPSVKQVNAFTLFPQTNSIQSLFTDSKSPFVAAPAKIKQILEEQKANQNFNKLQLTLEKLGLPQKKTATNFCSHHFKGGSEQYYFCKQCSYTQQPLDIVRICGKCWEPQKHAGHSYEKKVSFFAAGSCDCGQIQKLKINSFCQQHSQYNQIIQCHITEEQQKYFTQILTSLLQCAIYYNKISGHPTLVTKIIEFLMQINTNSVYYNRLTHSVLKEPSKYELQLRKPNNPNQFAFSFYSIISKIIIDIVKLLPHIASDLKTNMEMIKLICDPQNTTIDPKQIVRATTMQKLSDSGFFPYFFEKNYLKKLYSPEVKISYQKFTLNRIKYAKNIQQLSSINIKMLNKQIKYTYIKKMLSCFPSSQTLRNAIFLPIHKKPIADQNKQIIDYFKTIPPLIIISAIFILKSIVQLCHSDINNMKNARKLLIQNGISNNQIDQCLGWMTYVVYYYVAYSSTKQANIKISDFQIVTIYVLLQQCQYRKMYVDIIWIMLFYYSLNLEADSGRNAIANFVDVFHFMISVLIQSDITYNFSCNFDKPNIEMQKKAWFEKFLWGIKQIKQSTILQIRQKGLFLPKDASQMLKQLCSYDENEQVFTHKGKMNECKNIAYRFMPSPFINGFEDIYASKICQASQDEKLQQNSLAQKVINVLLNTDIVTTLAQAGWNLFLKGTFRNNDYMNQYLYIWLQKVYMRLSKFQTTSVQKLFQALNARLDIVARYCATQNQYFMIFKLISNGQISDSSSDEYNENQLVNQFIANNFTNNNEEKQKHICMHCYKSQSETNKLAYMCQLIKNNNSVSAFFGNNNISQTYIASCFHTIHINCFLKIKGQKNANVIKCTNCQLICNCLLPMYYTENKQNQLYIQACYNSMIVTAIQLASVYDLNSLFMILFKHITQRKGLFQFIQKSKTRTISKQNQQLNTFILLMKQIYINCSDKEREIYNKQIQQFILQIQKYQQQKQIKCVQQIIAQIVKQIATDVNMNDIIVNQKLLKQFASYVTSVEYEVLVNSIQQLLEKQLPLSIKGQQIKGVSNKIVYKSKLLKNVILPQKQSEQLLQMMLKAQRCLHCKNKQSNKVTTYCLFCGAIVCNPCLSKHSQIFHSKIFLIIQLNPTIIALGNQYYLISKQSYENQFKVPLHKGYGKEGFKTKDYVLNMENYTEIVNLFLQM